MVDFLLVHDVGHGSWCWGRVWGHLTSPVEHPPKLHARSTIGKVLALDLPRRVLRAGEEVSGTSLDDCVSAVTSEIKAQDLHDLIMVGHGMAAPILLQAAAKLDEPPRRIVLFAGLIPDQGKSALDMLPRPNRMGFKLMARLNAISRKELRLPKTAITHLYCNGMDPFDVIQMVGRFVPLPLELLQARLNLDDLALTCPITYVPLWRDRLLPTELQRRMAGRLGGVELVAELDSSHEVMMERPKQAADIILGYA